MRDSDTACMVDCDRPFQKFSPLPLAVVRDIDGWLAVGYNFDRLDGKGEKGIS